MASPGVPLQPPQPQPSHWIHTKVSAAAVTSMILGFVGLCAPIFSVVAIICGHLSISNINAARGGLTGRGMAATGLVFGYLAIIGWSVFGVAMFTAMKVADSRTAALFPVNETPIPQFPVLPEFETLEPSGVRVGQIALNGSGPGGRMEMRIYLPAGDEAPTGALTCVLTAPAGTNLLQGSGIGELNEEAYHDESLPYAEAGMAVVMYSIDGEASESLSLSEEAELADTTRAYNEFKAANAGVVNGRNALEFVLERMPLVDPSRIFSAGHSSAGTLSLLVAAHDRRLRGCIAYAPCGDVDAFHDGIISEFGVGLVFPGVRSFVERSSPVSHLKNLDLPVFLFQAEDDGVVSFEDAEAFHEEAKRVAAEAGLTKSDITFEVVPGGGHYDSMIEEGIPAAIRWIQAQ